MYMSKWFIYGKFVDTKLIIINVVCNEWDVLIDRWPFAIKEGNIDIL